MAVWGGLAIAVKRRESKNKGENERDKHLNAEFQRIAGIDKKALFSGQCKEIEENNRMRETRDFFKKIRDTKDRGTLQPESISLSTQYLLPLLACPWLPFCSVGTTQNLSGHLHQLWLAFQSTYLKKWL